MHREPAQTHIQQALDVHFIPRHFTAYAHKFARLKALFDNKGTRFDLNDA